MAKIYEIPALETAVPESKEYIRLKKYWDNYITEEEFLEKVKNYPWKEQKVTLGTGRQGADPEFYTYEIFLASLEAGNAKELANHLGTSVYKLRMYFLRKIPEIKDDKRGIALSIKLTQLLGYKKCSRCEGLLSIHIYANTKDINRSDGKVSQCPVCNYFAQQKPSIKKWHEENRERIKNDPVKHAKKLQSTRDWKIRTNYRARNDERYKARRPGWCNVNEIRKITKNCPIGYHVDHIIPLLGELVSGLDVPENLQYLPDHLNMAKGNAFIPCSADKIPLGINQLL